MASRLATAPQPSEAEIRAALNRIVASTALGGSPKLKDFLRYVVERALAGDGARIKGYTVAVEALGRGPDFDPQTDPIVRVEASRLRHLLDAFYAGECAHEQVVIELPRGGYVPNFRRRARAVATAVTAAGGRRAALRRLIELYRRRLEAMVAEVAIAEQIIALSRPKAGGTARCSACRPRVRLLPSAPSSCESARPADGREDRQIQQAQGATTARARRPRRGRDRRDAAHDRGDPRRL